MSKEMTIDEALKEMKDLLNAIEKAGMRGKECDMSILHNIGTNKNLHKKVFVVDPVEIYDTILHVADSVISGGFRL